MATFATVPGCQQC